jgi:hypothetical protein
MIPAQLTRISMPSSPEKKLADALRIADIEFSQRYTSGTKRAVRIPPFCRRQLRCNDLYSHACQLQGNSCADALRAAGNKSFFLCKTVELKVMEKLAINRKDNPHTAPYLNQRPQ